MIYKVAEVVSLVLTAVTLQLCAEVFFVWIGHAKKFIKGQREPWLWASMGVTTHFTVTFADNLYWGVAWAMHMIDSPTATWWFNHGVFANIPFRQIGTGLAAFFYLRASYSFHDKHMDDVFHRMLYAFIVGVIAVTLLLLG